MKNQAPVFYLLHHTPGPAWQKGTDFREQPGVAAHIQYMASFLAAGKLMIGGPFLDDSGGMMVYRAGDQAEAETIAQNDPAVQNGLLHVVVRPWLIAMSSIDLPT